MNNLQIPQSEVVILRSLARRIAELAAVAENQHKAQMWSRLTDLDHSVRPMLLTHLWELAWSQVLPDETTLLCQHETARRYERDMRQRLWTVENLNDDTVIEPVIRYPHCVTIKPYGSLAVKKVYAGSDHSHIGAGIFLPEITRKSDIEKLSDPIVRVDTDLREQYRRQADEVFGDILDVIPEGIYFAAKVIDEWAELRGMAQLYLDMIDDPQWTHAALQIIADNFRSRFTQCENLGVWGPWDASDPLGSTGLRFNPEIPNYPQVKQRGQLKLNESWAFTCAEAFTTVSPKMHDRFAFHYDRQLMPLFRFANIGCCEVLSDRIDYIRSIPNARRITVSEWANLEKAASSIGTDFVYGYKPSGVPFISKPWNPEMVRKEIREVLTHSRGCIVEIILNIGGTLGEDPGRQLIEWNR
ncbi:MAG: hypothetical protein IH586_17775, partial [Anaerolineaceae bacterium]|nr:hypothetical protein [Anaerolineaceae bacterium]